ncbi:hypothetical protein NBRC116587_22330 [Pseudoteredinibacter isoporae]
MIEKDYTPPSDPVFDSKMVTGDSVSLSWLESEDDHSNGKDISYLIYLFEDGDDVNFDSKEDFRTKGEVRAYLEDLPEKTRFNVYILSEDEFGNRSNPVGPASVETGVAHDKVTISESETVYNLTQMGVGHYISDNKVYIDADELNITLMVGDYLISYSEYEVFYLKVVDVSMKNGRYEIHTEDVSPFEFLTPGRISIGFLDDHNPYPSKSTEKTFGGEADEDLDGRVYYGRERVCL